MARRMRTPLRAAYNKALYALALDAVRQKMAAHRGELGHIRKGPRAERRMACHCVMEMGHISQDHFAEIMNLGRTTARQRWEDTWHQRDDCPLVNEICQQVIDELGALEHV